MEINRYDIKFIYFSNDFVWIVKTRMMTGVKGVNWDFSHKL